MQKFLPAGIRTTSQQEKRHREKNLPSPLLTTAQKRAIPIQYTVPAPSHTLPTSPIHLRNIFRRLSPPSPHPPCTLTLVSPLKPTQTASEAPEILLVRITRHVSRQHSSKRNHTRRMRAYQQCPRSIRVGIYVCDDASDGVGKAIVQRGYRFAVHGGY